MHVCMHVCIVIFLHQPFVSHSFIYEDIFTKFAENVYGCENMPVKILLLILKNSMATIADCSKIIDGDRLQKRQRVMVNDGEIFRGFSFEHFKSSVGGSRNWRVGHCVTSVLLDIRR